MSMFTTSFTSEEFFSFIKLLKRIYGDAVVDAKNTPIGDGSNAYAVVNNLTGRVSLRFRVNNRNGSTWLHFGPTSEVGDEFYHIGGTSLLLKMLQSFKAGAGKPTTITLNVDTQSMQCWVSTELMCTTYLPALGAAHALGDLSMRVVSNNTSSSGYFSYDPSVKDATSTLLKIAGAELNKNILPLKLEHRISLIREDDTKLRVVYARSHSSITLTSSVVSEVQTGDCDAFLLPDTIRAIHLMCGYKNATCRTVTSTEVGSLTENLARMGNLTMYTYVSFVSLPHQVGALVRRTADSESRIDAGNITPDATFLKALRALPNDERFAVPIVIMDNVDGALVFKTNNGAVLKPKISVANPGFSEEVLRIGFNANYLADILSLSVGDQVWINTAQWLSTLDSYKAFCVLAPVLNA